ncbi:Uncharacterised protein [Klebsiella pneumoniae]|uniref:Uncharacterized protein n=1 Tax=Klebsiella pneumoniae TaxID=573 RepID=A0A378F6V5_KLEPN|nr:Uncharacterised protein [Klebsiella pneumoniae]
MRVGRLPAWRAKATACASLRTVTRWPFSSSTPHTSTCCASAAAVAGSSATTTWTATIASRGAELAPAVEHGTAQRAVAIEMGGKDKVPVKAGGQFSTLQAGAEQKTVCPARRDRRGA